MKNHIERLDIVSFSENSTKEIETLKQNISILCDRLEEEDVEIQSFLVEEKRKERVLAEVEALFNRFPNENDRPALFGIPVGVKDIFRIDGQPTKAGSELPSELFEGDQAWIVSRLKSQGAIIFGKTVTTEFAYFSPGPTKNPFNLEHTPGGSSSGSAAAVAAGFIPLAIGSQTIGSIGRPASYCGVFGFKPSFGRIPSKGIIPFSRSADHIGFFTQDFEGIQIASKTLIPSWEMSEKGNKSKPVLAIPTGNYLNQADPEMLEFFNNQIEMLEKDGFIIKRIDCLDEIELINSMHRAMVAAEFAQVHDQWFEQCPEKYSEHSTALILEGRAVSEEKLVDYQAYRFELLEEFEAIKQDYGFDIWMAPSALGAAPHGLTSTGSPLMNLPWTMAGLPVLSAPMGKNKENLPLGIQFIGSFMEDEVLLNQLRFLRGYFQII